LLQFSNTTGREERGERERERGKRGLKRERG